MRKSVGNLTPVSSGSLLSSGSFSQFPPLSQKARLSAKMLYSEIGKAIIGVTAAKVCFVRRMCENYGRPTIFAQTSR